MRVAICEDEKNDRVRLASCLEAEFNKRRLSVEVSIYESGEALLSAADKTPFQIYFLDIFMSGISGVEVAKALREKSKDAAIVFTTTSRDFLAEGFAVDAAHYLFKPVQETEIAEALDRCLRQIGEAERYVELTINRENCRILLYDVMWVESKDKVCCLHLRSGEQQTYLRLNELEQRLNDPRFLRCQHSFLINMEFVSSVENGCFCMVDNANIPMRQSERAQLRTIYENYLFEKMRGRR